MDTRYGFLYATIRGKIKGMQEISVSTKKKKLVFSVLLYAAVAAAAQHIAIKRRKAHKCTKIIVKLFLKW